MNIHVSLAKKKKKRKQKDNKHSCDGDRALNTPPTVRFSPFIGSVSAKKPKSQLGIYFSLQQVFHLALPLKQFSK